MSDPMTEWNIQEIAAEARRVGLCAHIGSPPAPGLLPYLCSLGIGHSGAHLARDHHNGFVYDSWP